MRRLHELPVIAAEYLQEQGIAADVIYHGTGERDAQEVCVTVELASVVAAPLGMGDYLGVESEESAQAGSEVYARKASVVLRFVLYAAKSLGESGLRERAQAIFSLLTQERLAGFHVLKLEQGESEFQAGRGQFRCAMTAELQGSVRAYMDTETGIFTDFWIAGTLS